MESYIKRMIALAQKRIAGYPRDKTEFERMVDWIFEDIRHRPGNNTTRDDVVCIASEAMEERQS